LMEVYQFLNTISMDHYSRDVSSLAVLVVLLEITWIINAILV
jgi:hypothetical protein